MRHVYFVVEGPHDVEVIGHLVKRRGLERIKKLDMLHEYWNPLVPRVFPIDGDLLRRVPVPTFFASQDYSVAVQSAIGIDNIERTIEAGFNALDVEPSGLGVVLDADYDEPALVRWQRMVAKMPGRNAGHRPGTVSAGPPRTGVYILPDNNSPGTLEDLLLACASEAYPSLLSSARAWIDPLDPQDRLIFRNTVERADFGRPCGKSKAVAGSIASVLQPGKAIQVSIQDNFWLRDPRALALPIVLALQAFVDDVLGIGASTPVATTQGHPG